MSPILGIWASSQQPALATSYESIATVTVGAGGSSSITFSSIPSTYKHLQIRGIGRATGTAVDYNAMAIQFNSDTSSAYNFHQLSGNGTSASAYGSSSVTSAQGQLVAGGSSTSNAFGVNVIDILDYVDTNKNKTIRALMGAEFNNSNSVVQFSSGLWRSTSAINSITLFMTAVPSVNFAQYSSFALYGIKGA